MVSRRLHPGQGQQSPLAAEAKSVAKARPSPRRRASADRAGSVDLLRGRSRPDPAPTPGPDLGSSQLAPLADEPLVAEARLDGLVDDPRPDARRRSPPSRVGDVCRSALESTPPQRHALGRGRRWPSGPGCPHPDASTTSASRSSPELRRRTARLRSWPVRS